MKISLKDFSFRGKVLFLYFKEYNFIMKIIRLITAVLLSASIAFTAFYGRYKIAESTIDKSPTEYKGVITVWQIDTFEGGTGSRKQFLLKAARSFERKNDGVLVMVVNQTVEGARDALQAGNVPDLISFGCGADISGFGEISPARKVKGGLVGDKCFATAWCRGGYVLIENPSLVEKAEKIIHFDELLVSQAEFTQPLTALVLEGITANKVEVKPPMDAYVKFTAGKTPYFLATQRDLVRLKNRGFEVNAYPLTAYNDLYQYISVTATDQIKRFYAQEFTEHLLSDAVQGTLNEIAMFSEFVKVKYDDEKFIDVQSVANFSTISAFTPSEKLKELQEISLLAVSGSADALNKIKNILV